jgi:hypothetical protein
MDDKYCCETMRSAVEDWGGVEIGDDGRWLISDVFGEVYHVIKHCPWCGQELKREE